MPTTQTPAQPPTPTRLRRDHPSDLGYHGARPPEILP